MIVERNVPLLLSLVRDLAADLARDQPTMMVVDAAEGYNAVHDLCRLVAGAAASIAGIGTQLYEYAVTRSPRLADAAFELELDDAELHAKLERARAEAGTLADIDELLSRYGAETYRCEAFRRVADWTAIDGGAPPMYESIGEQRVASGRYTSVIRREHLLALRDDLRGAVAKHSCAY